VRPMTREGASHTLRDYDATNSRSLMNRIGWSTIPVDCCTEFKARGTMNELVRMNFESWDLLERSHEMLSTAHLKSNAELSERCEHSSRRPKKDPSMTLKIHLMARKSCLLLTAFAAALICGGSGQALAQNPPPAGFVALFNGTDLTGWRGGNTYDPAKLAALPEADRLKQIEAWTKTMKEHWSVENGELVNDGKGDYATTEKDFGDFELLVEYKTVAGADSGVYLRGCPQVQIWDINQPSLAKAPDRNPNKGSGGLFNNTPKTPGRDPLVVADRAFGEWNQFRIVLVDSHATVWLNEKLVVDHAVMENYYDRKGKLPVTGPVQLQTHGGEIRWRNIFLREINKEEAAKILELGAKNVLK
jgi:hypothetical protein